ncbi:MAG: STAS domain-containing protein [Clostridia bacterium]|nr:STAS domain-containing protein [Clostridia bacterium]
MSATVYEKNGSTLTVKPEGRLDTATSPVLERELQERLDGVQEIIMDFEKVEYISSGGLRVLLTVEQTMEARDGSLRLIHVNENIIEIFDLVGFMDVVTVERD